LRSCGNSRSFRTLHTGCSPRSRGRSYYYNTDGKSDYQQTMLSVKAEFESLQLPLAYFQFDSWWYFKNNDSQPRPPSAASSGAVGDPVQVPKGALLLWEPMPEVFPSGMTGWLGLPLALHNRWFARENNYT
jgi:hypothetical protein